MFLRPIPARSVPVHEPETQPLVGIAYAKNDLGQNTLRRPPVAVDNQPWRVLDMASFAGKPVPVQDWIIPQWLPSKVVTLHYADGGVGKTLLALQLMVACATGGTWLGLPVEPCNSVGLFSEDDTDVLQRVIDNIRRSKGLAWEDLAGMSPIDGMGQDNTLVRFERDGRMVLTPRFTRLRQQALDTNSRLVVIDTAATTFGGNEIDRAQVTAFVGTALTSLAQDINGAVLLNAHPSVSGIASGDLRSGSTAWNNSCRSRWALTRPAGEDGKPDMRSPDRILTRQKANMAATGDSVTMSWSEGAFVTPQGMGVAGVEAGIVESAAERVFLDILKHCNDGGVSVSQSRNAGNYAPKIFAKRPDAKGLTWRQFEKAMHSLMATDVISLQKYGRASDSRTMLVITPEAVAVPSD